MAAASGDDRRPSGEKDLVERLINAAYEAERRLTQQEVDAALGLGPRADPA